MPLVHAQYVFHRGKPPLLVSVPASFSPLSPFPSPLSPLLSPLSPVFSPLSPLPYILLIYTIIEPSSDATKWTILSCVWHLIITSNWLPVLESLGTLEEPLETFGFLGALKSHRTVQSRGTLQSGPAELSNRAESTKPWDLSALSNLPELPNHSDLLDLSALSDLSVLGPSNVTRISEL